MPRDVNYEELFKQLNHAKDTTTLFEVDCGSVVVAKREYMKAMRLLKSLHFPNVFISRSGSVLTLSYSDKNITVLKVSSNG